MVAYNDDALRGCVRVHCVCACVCLVDHHDVRRPSYCPNGGAEVTFDAATGTIYNVSMRARVCVFCNARDAGAGDCWWSSQQRDRS
jgi:hypothetical protein